MVEARIRGKKFPLCLTVAALDRINEKCGSLKGFLEFLKGDGDVSSVASNTAWALALLMECGEESRILNAELTGEKAERREVPGEEMIRTMCTPGEMRRYRNDVVAAVNESLRQEIEADHSKNVHHAE